MAAFSFAPKLPTIQIKRCRMRMQRIKPAFWLLLASLWLGAQIAPANAADGDQYLGTWSGTWRGDDSSGHFQLTLERGSEGKGTGSIAVRQDGGGGAASAGS